MKKLLLILLFLSSLVGKTLAVDYSQDANCQGAWLFTEGSGTTVDDSSANTNTGTFASSGHPSWAAMSGTNAPTYANYLVDFDGTSSDYITVGDITSLDGATTFTIIQWISPDSITNSPKPFAKWGGAYPAFSVYMIQIGSSGNIIGGAAKSGSDLTAHQSANTISTGQWSNVAAVWEGLTSWTFYINGVASDDTTVVDFGSVTEIGNSSDILYLGKSSEALSELNGKMSETGLFNDVLTSTEINDIMDNGLKPAVVASATRIQGAILQGVVLN